LCLFNTILFLSLPLYHVKIQKNSNKSCGNSQNLLLTKGFLRNEVKNMSNENENYDLEELNNLINVDLDENNGEETKEDETRNSKSNKKISEFQKTIELLFSELEKAKAESKEKQLHAKELKDEIINMMNDKGLDEVIINGLDSVVVLTITYPEKETLDKKSLAQALGISQKDLSKPEVIISLTKEGKITTDMIDKFTIIEERMQFSAQDYNPEDN